MRHLIVFFLAIIVLQPATIILLKKRDGTEIGVLAAALLAGRRICRLFGIMQQPEGGDLLGGKSVEMALVEAERQGEPPHQNPRDRQ